MGAEDTQTTTEPTTDSPPDPDKQDSPATNPEVAKALAEAAKWKAHARKHEDRNKDLLAKAERWDKHEEESRSEQEKAVIEARNQGRAEAGIAAVEAIFQLAVRGAMDEDKAKALFAPLDKKSFLGDDLMPDRNKIDAYISALTPVKAGTDSGPDMGQGRRASGSATGIAAGAAEYLANKAKRTGSGISAANQT